MGQQRYLDFDVVVGLPNADYPANSERSTRYRKRSRFDVPYGTLIAPVTVPFGASAATQCLFRWLQSAEFFVDPMCMRTAWAR